MTEMDIAKELFSEEEQAQTRIYYGYTRSDGVAGGEVEIELDEFEETFAAHCDVDVVSGTRIKFALDPTGRYILTMRDVSSSGSGSGVTKISAGDGISISPTSGTGEVTIVNNGVTEVKGDSPIEVNTSEKKATVSLETTQVAGKYGQSADTTLANGGAFTVPYTTFDDYGRATAAKDSSVTLPTITQGDGIQVSGTTSITIKNAGVTSVEGSDYISVNRTTGAVTVTNNGVTSLRGTSSATSCANIQVSGGSVVDSDSGSRKGDLQVGVSINTSSDYTSSNSIVLFTQEGAHNLYTALKGAFSAATTLSGNIGGNDANVSMGEESLYGEGLSVTGSGSSRGIKVSKDCIVFVSAIVHMPMQTATDKTVSIRNNQGYAPIAGAPTIGDDTTIHSSVFAVGPGMYQLDKDTTFTVEPNNDAVIQEFALTVQRWQL